MRQQLGADHPPRPLGRAGPEPPRPPFRWVGYDGDAGHGCGNHLHLSWNHARRPSSSSPNGSKSSPTAHAGTHDSACRGEAASAEAAGKPTPPRQGPTGRHLPGPDRRRLPAAGD